MIPKQITYFLCCSESCTFFSYFERVSKYHQMLGRGRKTCPALTKQIWSALPPMPSFMVKYPPPTAINTMQPFCSAQTQIRRIWRTNAKKRPIHKHLWRWPLSCGISCQCPLGRWHQILLTSPYFSSYIGRNSRNVFSLNSQHSSYDMLLNILTASMEHKTHVGRSLASSQAFIRKQNFSI